MILEVTFLEFLLNCLRCKNCEYVTVFILFYPCGLFTTTIIHPAVSKYQFWYQKFSYKCVNRSKKEQFWCTKLSYNAQRHSVQWEISELNSDKTEVVLGQLLEDTVVVQCSFEGYSVLFLEGIVILVMRVMYRRMKHGF